MELLEKGMNFRGANQCLQGDTWRPKTQQFHLKSASNHSLETSRNQSTSNKKLRSALGMTIHKSQTEQRKTKVSKIESITFSNKD